VNPYQHLQLPAVESDVARLEGLLAASVVFGDEYLDQVTTHLIRAGGKRLRPLLAIASATFGERDANQDDFMGGVTVELMHLASLYHDDVMDEAEIRRNVSSVNARYGNLIAIVGGDYLMARSAGIAADHGVEMARLMAHTLAWLTRGQAAEVKRNYDVARTEAEYYEAIEGKTAALMAASCRVGAITAGHSDDVKEGLTEFGRCFGMVYQLRDDILDVIDVNNKLGKPAGQDLAEGVYNLPTLASLQSASHGPALRELLGAPLSDEQREEARALVIAGGGIEASIAAAADFVTQAKQALTVVPSDGLQRGLGAFLDSLMAEFPAY
jgi:heptaprenyl diphosphate synthase